MQSKTIRSTPYSVEENLLSSRRLPHFGTMSSLCFGCFKLVKFEQRSSLACVLFSLYITLCVWSGNYS